MTLTENLQVPHFLVVKMTTKLVKMTIELLKHATKLVKM